MTTKKLKQHTAPLKNRWPTVKADTNDEAPKEKLRKRKTTSQPVPFIELTEGKIFVLNKIRFKMNP